MPPFQFRLAWTSTFFNRNKFCFTGGYFEVAVQLPGTNNVAGMWPAIWTMGNLGRAGYGATLEGMVRSPTSLLASDTKADTFDSGLTLTTHAMLGPRLTKRVTVYLARHSLMGIMRITMRYPTYLVKGYRGVPAKAKIIQGLSTLMVRTLGEPPQR